MAMWKCRLAGALGGVVVGGSVVLGAYALEGVVDSAVALRDSSNFEKARQQLLDRHAPQSATLFNGASRPTLEIMHDDTHGVTCWSRKGYQETNLSCLPDWMLNPAQRKPVTEPCLVKDVGVSEACRLLLDPQGVAQ